MRHKLLRLLLIPAAVLALAASVLGIAELAVRLEPVTAASQPPAGEYVRLQADERLFTLFAALNAGATTRRTTSGACRRCASRCARRWRTSRCPA